MEGRPAALTTAGAVRAAVVVDAALDRVALDGERTFARTRIVALLLLFALWATLVALDPAPLISTSTFLLVLIGVALVFAIVVDVVVRRAVRATRRLALLSIVVDTVAAGAVLLLVARAPPPDYIGVFHITGLPIVAIAIAAAGLRLSRTNVVVAGVIAAVVAVVAYVCDRAWNPTLTEEAPRHLVITLVLLGLATVVGVLAAARTRRVALEAEQQTLLAERARLHLGAYVSEEVAALSLKSDEVRLGGERLRCAVLFTDLRNFTGQSESADAQAMVSAINAYFEGMVACVKQHGGVVDKYIGDSLMAVFGAPTSRGNDAGNALRAAKAMRAALARLNADRSARGLAPLAHGIGVHFGEVVAGNIGTAERTQYTVIGDVVNVAARLESETKKAGVDVLVSKDVVDAAVAIDAAIDVDVVAVGGDDGIVVKGRAAPVRVFTIGGSA